MSDLRDLYQEVILDHSRRPRNSRHPEHPTCSAKGDNPLCGDKITVYLTVADGRITDAAFEGRGCAISTASASLMTELVKGKSIEAAEALFHRVRDLMTGTGEISDNDDEDIERLAPLAGVRQYPMRVKCATLSWHTLMAALREDHPPVSTEQDEGRTP